MRRGSTPSRQGWFYRRRKARPRGRQLSHRNRLERSGIRKCGWGKLGIADWRRGRGPGHVGDEWARMQHLLSSKFQITGEGSAAAGPVGRHASAGTNWKLNTEMLTYSRSKGAFAGLTLEGAVIEKDDDSTIAIYGSNEPFRSILAGKVATPSAAKDFVHAVSGAGSRDQRRRGERVEISKFPRRTYWERG